VSPVRTVAVISPGEMGAGVARHLRDSGLRVVTALAGRSPRTRERAAAAGMEDAGSLAGAVGAADMLLAILPPGRALELARAVGRDAGPIYVDCNAVSPATARAVGAAVGERYVDAGIIGGPEAPRIYASGPHARELAALPLDVRVLDGEIGQASALKMCYAALTKGLSALLAESMVAAAEHGVAGALREELADSQPQFLAGARRLAGVVPKAYRWIAEMEEIAATFDQVGLTPRMLLGAADVYRLVESARAGSAGPLDSLDAVVDALRACAAPPRRPA
jgi:putative dehydrogenase